MGSGPFFLSRSCSKRPKTTVFPITEVVSQNEFFDYNAKYNGQVSEITPARLSADVFRYETKDLQLTEVGGAAGNSNSVKTARKVIGQGVEFNLELLPVDSLFITMGGSYNKATIRDNKLEVAGCNPSACTVLNPVGPNGGFLT